MLLISHSDPEFHTPGEPKKSSRLSVLCRLSGCRPFFFMFRKRPAGLQDEMAQAFLFLKTGFHFFGERLPEDGKGAGFVVGALDGPVEMGGGHADDVQ